MIVTLLGSGMMGTALCLPLLDRGHEVRLVGTHLDRGLIDALRATGVHSKLGISLPGASSFFQLEELASAMRGADLVALGVSSAGVRWAGEHLAPYVRPGLPILMVSKGLEWDGSRFVVMPDLLQAELPEATRDSIHPVAIGGPCIAGELARRVETCVVFTGRDLATVDQVAELCRTEYYHVRTSADVVGTEVCAALKNGYAMACGFGAGIHERLGGIHGSSVAWHNHEAAVFAQSVLEMARLVELAGGSPGAAHGLPGAGDLMVTCQGGRTGRFGRWLGTGLTLEQAISKMEGATLECLEIIRTLGRAIPALEAAGRLGPSELPLMRHLIAIVEQGRPATVPFAALHR